MGKKLGMTDAISRSAVLEIINDQSYDTAYPSEHDELESKINTYRDELRAEHTEAVKNNEYSYQTGICYSNLYAQCEKLADFAINVTEAIVKVQK